MSPISTVFKARPLEPARLFLMIPFESPINNAEPVTKMVRNTIELISNVMISDEFNVVTLITIMEKPDTFIIDKPHFEYFLGKVQPFIQNE